MALSPNIFCARALVAQYGEESWAQKDMVLEGLRLGSGCRDYKDRARCNLPAPKNAFRVVPGVIWLLICSKCI